MMTASEFKSKSNIFLHRRKNPIIKDIDRLLKEHAKSRSENRKMKCLVYIYMMCKQYFVAKPDGRRGDAVQELMDQVRLILNSAEFKRQIAKKAGGRHYSNGIERDAMATSGASATGLSGGYTFEGILPQKNFIQKMQLNMASILGSDEKYFGVSYIAHSVEDKMRHDDPSLSIEDAAKLAPKMLSSMPFSQILDQLHAMWNGIETLDFQYLNASQRTDFLVSFRSGKLVYTTRNAPVDTGISWDKPARMPYVIDTAERLYVLDKGGVGTKYNHSSLLSGAPVICAGEVAVVQGELKHVDNNSGHYKPDTDNLHDAVRILDHNGLNIRLFTVEDMKTKQTYATGAAFLAASRGGGIIRGQAMAH